jgi:hypothetical protein
MYKSDGVYSASTGYVTWGAPYLANLKVGSLSAITANLGIVSISTGGDLHSGKTSYSDNSTSGFYLGNESGTPKFNIGNSTSYLKWDGQKVLVAGAVDTNSYVIARGLSASSVVVPLAFNTTINVNPRIYGLATGDSFNDSTYGYPVGILGYSDNTSVTSGLSGYSNFGVLGVAVSTRNVSGDTGSTYGGVFSARNNAPYGRVYGAYCSATSTSTSLATGLYVNLTTGGSSNSSGIEISSGSFPAIRTSSGILCGNITCTGNITAPGSITAYSASDINLKKHLKVIKDPLDKLLTLSGYTYLWKDSYLKKQGGHDGRLIRRHDVGIVAQEVQKVLPEAVMEKDNGELGVAYTKLIPLIIEAIKELNHKVDVMKGSEYV